MPKEEGKVIVLKIDKSVLGNKGGKNG